MDATRIVSKLSSLGFNVSSGVPCGILGEIIRAFGDRDKFLHVPALNEREAVGIAAGSWLAGKKPVLYMQNSGLFLSSNDIASLLIASRIPVLMFVSHRGCEGETATQHMVTGRCTEGLLSMFGLHYSGLDDKGVAIDAAQDFMNSESLPAAVLLKRSILNTKSGKPFSGDEDDSSKRMCGKLTDFSRHDVCSLDRDSALDHIVRYVNGRTALFSSTGLISRSVFERYDGPNCFYNAGGFGITSAIGLGFALARPEIKTVVIEGDGSAMAGMGNIASIGHHAPKNLVHIVLDNHSYASCSEELSISGHANLAETALVQGYRNVFLTNSAEGLWKAMSLSSGLCGSTFIKVGIALGGRRYFKRPSDMPGTAARFRKHFSGK